MQIKLNLKLRDLFRRTPRRPRTPRIKVPPIVPPKLEGAPTGFPRDKVERILKKAFEVQVRRGGVYRTISDEALPIGQALKLGSKRTKATLAATFRLVEKGTTKKKDIKFELGKGFRAPKSGEKLTFVEKKPLRLKKGTKEISEILTIRGKKPRKKRRKKK